jgi:diadenosine tetraphosphate (Ap4A) HIT family hydrolase
MAATSWPDDWRARFAGESCLICDALGQGDSDYWIHVADGACTEVYIDRGSQIRGYSVAVWRPGHVAEPTELEPEAAGAYWQDVMAVGRAVLAAFNPLKINYFTLGNTVPHLHTHVVPRFEGDPAPGGPIAWDHVVGPGTFAEEELRSQAAALRRAGLGGRGKPHHAVGGVRHGGASTP